MNPRIPYNLTALRNLLERGEVYLFANGLNASTLKLTKTGRVSEKVLGDRAKVWSLKGFDKDLKRSSDYYELQEAG